MPGRSAWWCAGRRGRRPLARRAAGLPRRNWREHCSSPEWVSLANGRSRHLPPPPLSPPDKPRKDPAPVSPPLRCDAVLRGGDERVRSVCGLTCLAIPARRVTRRTIRAAPCRSNRSRPERGTAARSAIADGQVDRVGGPRGERDGDDLPPLRMMARVRWPRSSRGARCRAGGLDTRSPLRASREIRACSAACRARRRRGGRRLRCGPGRWRATRSPAGAGGRARPGECRGVLRRRRTCRTRDRAQPAGDRGPGPAGGFQFAGEGLDVGAADREQRQGPGRHQPVNWRRSRV